MKRLLSIASGDQNKLHSSYKVNPLVDVNLVDLKIGDHVDIK